MDWVRWSTAEGLGLKCTVRHCVQLYAEWCTVKWLWDRSRIQGTFPRVQFTRGWYRLCLVQSALITTKLSWRGSASTVHPPTTTSGTREVFVSIFPHAMSSFLFSLIQPAVLLSSADISEMMLQFQGTMMMNLLEASAAEDWNEVVIGNLTTPGRVRLFAVKWKHQLWCVKSLFFSV